MPDPVIDKVDGLLGQEVLQRRYALGLDEFPEASQML
jgi:hypothetical protein